MSEERNPAIQAAKDPAHSDDLLMPKVIYVLYILGPFFWLTGVVGVVMAYVYKDGAPEWMQSHYRFQIDTFWKGLAFLLPGVLLTFVLIGYLVLLFWVVWLLVRAVKGLKALSERRPVERPARWGF
ncbi:Uncharacterized membrane protein [Ectothiorhodospira mobilis]|uniref:Uncharacterized membrane protein n=1 Tax=Ectothiorhodospira mobilis TaxID=195064 RepID=A0A1I4RXH0_ECTMO|nr:hypothetical protein [Ectothiorhodospira mobilis]SFM56704.1 Uncharacterized membrane protein [Ectothiorhodospira mobilis]